MNELHIALEDCLDALQHGKSLESALQRYPHLAHELQPLLQVAVTAKAGASTTVPDNVRRRGRSLVLRRASELRASARTINGWAILAHGLPRFAAAIGLVFVLAVTSTGLVSASSGALPGDQLYPVKRSWESVQLFLVLSPQEHVLLESRYEQERLNEIDDLLLQGRSASIMFSGLVMQGQDGQWVISGIPVSLGSSTNKPLTGIRYGLPVTVAGVTGANGIVAAERIQVLQPGAPLPPLEPTDLENRPLVVGGMDGASVATAPPPSSISTPVPLLALPQLTGPEPDQPGSDITSYQFSGLVESMQGNTWNINGQIVRLDHAVVSGTAIVGSAVEFEGYYSSDGKFIVTTLHVQPVPAHVGHGGNSGGDGSGGGSGGGGQGGGEGGGGGEGQGGGDP